MMVFRVEIELNNRIFKDQFFAESLQELEEKIKAVFPKGRIVSIVGG